MQVDILCFSCDQSPGQVDFAKQFENSITAVQVAEQAKVVNEYEQQAGTMSFCCSFLFLSNESHDAGRALRVLHHSSPH